MLNKTKWWAPLSFSFCLLLIFFFIIFFLVINRVQSLSLLITKMYDHPLTVSNTVLKIDRNIVKIHRTMKDVALANDISDITTASKLVDSYENDIFDDFKIIEERFLGDDTLYTKALAQFKFWKLIRDEVISLMHQGKRKEAADITKGRGAQHVALLERSMNKLYNFAQYKAKSFHENALMVNSKTMVTTYVITCILISMGAIFIFFLARVESKKHWFIQALEQSEERFHKFFENAPEYCFMISPDGTIININRSAVRALGYRKKELIGKPLLSTIYSPSSIEKCKKLFTKWRETGTITNEELNIITKSGVEKTVLLSAESIKDKDGKSLHSISIQRDITEFKLLQEKEQENQIALAAAKSAVDIIEAMEEGVLLFDITGNLISINPGFEKMTGYQKGYFERMHVSELLKIIMKKNDLVAAMRLYTHSKTLRISTPISVSLQKKDGEELFTIVSTNLIKSKNGEITSIVFTIKDISALKRKEQELNRVFELSIDLFCIANLDGYFLRINSAFNRTLGFTEEELFAKPFIEFAHPEDKNATQQKLQQLREGKPTVYFENRYQCKNGQYKWLGWSAIPVKEENAFFAVARDITDLKKAEVILQRSKESLAEAQRIAHLGNWDWYIEKNELTWSDEIYRIFGLEPQSFGATYDAFLESVHPDDREFVKDSVNRALENNIPYNIDHRIVLPNGDERIVHEQANLIHNSQGKPVRMVGTVQDITNREKVKIKLQRSYETLSVINSILEFSTEPISLEDLFKKTLHLILSVSTFSFEPKGCIFLAEKNSDNFKMLADVGLDNQIVESCRELAPGNCLCGQAAFKKKMLFYKPLETKHESRYKCINNYGHYCVPISYGNEVLGIINIYIKAGHSFDERGGEFLTAIANSLAGIIIKIRTVQEKTILEDMVKQSQHLKMLGQLTSGVAHEVRNPLNSIVAIAEALFTDIGDNPEYQPYLEHIRKQVDRLSHLMQELLDFGRPGQKSDMHPESMTSILFETVNTWKHSSIHKDYKVRIIEPPDMGELYIQANKIKFQQVLLNLIDNACVHSPENKDIVISVEKSGNGSMAVKVSDKGSGVPGEHLPNIFDPFFTTRKNGIGLGLSIVKNIIELHGGKITAYNNKPLPGLTVVITLPLVMYKKDVVSV